MSVKENINREKYPLVSVLCLSMNHKKYVRQSFESVVNQTYPNLEIIYVDNCSSDGTFEVANDIFAKSGLPYKGVKRERSYSIPENLNFLIQQASGKYLAPQSGDDWWELTNIEEKVAYYEKHPEIGLLHGNGYYYYQDINKSVLPPNSDQFKSGFVFGDILLGGIYFPIGYMIRKDVFDGVGLYDETIAVDDLDMWLRISSKYPLGYFDKPLVYYRRTSNSFCTNPERNFTSSLQTLNKYKGHHLFGKAYKNYIQFYIYALANKEQSFRTLKTIIKYYDFNWFYNKQLVKVLLGMLKFYRPKV